MGSFGEPSPRRRDLLTTDEKKLALRNALRYFPASLHDVLAPSLLLTARKGADLHVPLQA
jgi:hypothetical protein